MTADLETKQNMTWVRNPHYGFVRCNDNEISQNMGDAHCFRKLSETTLAVVFWLTS